MGAPALGERKGENRRRGQERIERIGPVGHEGVARERAGGERREAQRDGGKRRTPAPRFALRRGDCRCGSRGAVIGPRRQDRPLESGEEDGRQRQDRGHINDELQRERRRGEHGLQRDDDDEVKEIDRVRDAAEVKACASDEARAEEALGPPRRADQDHAERGGNVRKRLLSRRAAGDRQDRNREFARDRGRKQREKRGEAPSA